MIASRISECLRKRSIVVEYDSDSVTPTATCLNQDGVVFVICLYRGGVGLGGMGIGPKDGSGSGSRVGVKVGTGPSIQSAYGSGMDDSCASSSASGSVATSAQSQSHYSVASSSIPNALQPDFSHGVIVECMRIRGDLNSFHRDCQAVLACASGDSDGLDDLRSRRVSMWHSLPGFGGRASRARQPFGRLGMEEIEWNGAEQDVMPNLVSVRDAQEKRGRKSSPPAAVLKKTTTRGPRRNAKNDADVILKALASVLDIVEMDRVDARLLGMERLVFLTDVRSSGLERAYLASLSILGSNLSSQSGASNPGAAPPGNPNEDDAGTGSSLFFHKAYSLSQLQERLILFATGKFNQITTQAHLMAENDYHDHEDENDQGYPHHPHTSTSYYEEDPCEIFTEYNIKIRRCAMQALTNALYNVIHYSDNFPLLPKPTCEEFMTLEFLEKIGDDLRGASRPPMASLGSAHEATYAAKFIHLIASYSAEGHRFVHGAVVGTPSRSVFGLLDMARECGSLMHRSLEMEAQLAQVAISHKMNP